MNRVYFVGPSGSGKTTLMVSKLYNELQGLNKKQVKLFIISKTAKYQQVFDHIEPWVTDWYDYVNSSTMNYLADIVEENLNKKNPKQIIIVFDDQGTNTYIKLEKKNNKLNELIEGAIHLKVSLLFCFQQIQQMTTAMRDNFDAIFMFRPLNDKQKKIFKEEFCGDLSDEAYDELTRAGWNLMSNHNYIAVVRRNGEDETTRFFINESEISFKGIGNKYL